MTRSGGLRAQRLMASLGAIALLGGALCWALPQEAVVIRAPSDLGTVDGREDTPVPVSLTNATLGVISVEIPPSCCSQPDTPYVQLFPLQTAKLTVTLATHKLALGPGSHPVAVEYVKNGRKALAKKDVHFTIVRP